MIKPIHFILAPPASLSPPFPLPATFEEERMAFLNVWDNMAVDKGTR
jgi:hypothetical protein